MAASLGGIEYSELLGASAASGVVVNMIRAAQPGSVTLVSTDGARKIEFSTNGGLNYFQPTYDQSPAAFILAAYTAPITHARFTGAATDRYTVL